ncbi:MAG: amino acid permease C-terminal domain-containing protein [Methanomicrobiaceae archaeon]|nr:amino acid permease C-terminal domain-containing protein [Methanomicrobiaceae archaeon]
MVAEQVNIGTPAAFIIVTVGVIVPRRTQPDLTRPFRVPFVPPLIPVLCIISCGYLILSLPIITHARFIVCLLFGLGIYFFSGQYHSAFHRNPRTRDEGGRCIDEEDENLVYQDLRHVRLSGMAK